MLSYAVRNGKLIHLKLYISLQLRKMGIKLSCGDDLPVRLSTIHGWLMLNMLFHYQVDLKIWKKLLIFWIGVPCIGNVGSCTYDNVCPLLPCPPSFVENGIPCQCPIPKVCYRLRFKFKRFSFIFMAVAR